MGEPSTDVGPGPSAAGGGGQALPTRIGLVQGVALYLSAVIGAGVLVLPGQAASEAGPSSLLAWAFSVLLGVPLAWTFATMATRWPGAGGVATFVERAFGPTSGGIVGWWYFAAGSIGQTVVPLTGGYYVADAAGLGPGASYAVAGGVLALAVAGNLVGVRLGGFVQIALAVAVALVLALAIASAMPDLDAHRLSPFAPGGVGGVGRAVVVLFFAFAGWEAITHLSGVPRRRPGSASGHGDHRRDRGRAVHGARRRGRAHRHLR